MRIPYIISQNTYTEYDPSLETKLLVNERGRKLISEDLDTDEGVHSLVSLCMKCIANHFEKYPVINDLMLCADRDFLLENLPVDLPLQLTIPLIDDEIFWLQTFKKRFGVMSQHKHQGWTWRCLFLEHHMQELIENASPEVDIDEEMEEITTLLNPFIHRLVIKQLNVWQPTLTKFKDDTADLCDHINLEPILKRLVNIQDLSITFGIKKMGENFKMSNFNVSLDDMRHLGEALLHLKSLKTFKLRNSNIDDRHIQILIKDIINLSSLEELSIVSCLIGDRGALCIAKMMMCHENLTKLNLTNNFISGVGAEGIGFALMQQKCCPIKLLNLRLNPLGHRGVMGLFRALVRVQKLEELVISGCGFNDETSVRLGTVLQLSETLMNIDISNNWCRTGEHHILEAVMVNSTLHWMDLRETNISQDVLNKINKKLAKNRRGGESSDEEDEVVAVNIEEEEEEEEFEEEEEEEEEEEKYLVIPPRKEERDSTEAKVEPETEPIPEEEKVVVDRLSDADKFKQKSSVQINANAKAETEPKSMEQSKRKVIIKLDTKEIVTKAGKPAVSQIKVND